jgi:hypothetical protein
MSAAAADASPLFDDDAALEVELRGPIAAVIDQKDDRAEFEFELLTGDVSVELKVRARGNSRLRVCSFPPLRFDFPRRSAPSDSVFAGQDRLKLVTHCTTRSRDASNVFDEYLAYRLFNLVSDFSYRVRLLRLTYTDTDERLDPEARERYAFLVESDEELAERTASTALELEGVVYSRLDHDQVDLVYVFQYLIGNTDWSLVTAFTDEFCCHNGDLFEKGGKYFLVPYDFDLAGLVDASYAKPDGSLPIRSVRTRLYRGYCTPRSGLSAALQRILARESAIREIAASVPAPEPRDRERRLEYLDDFFAKAADQESLLDEFERRCIR